ncbi:MAG: DUF1592 domain-containing protein [Gemmatimonadota bacterium]|nr:DUF1592 domain-containing protein [Gemmatimonadota bacterium]
MKTLVTAPVVLGTLMVLAGQPTGTIPSVGAKGDLLVAPSAPLSADASHVTLGLDTYTGEAADLTPEELTAVVRQYCQVCHNEVMLTGNLSLQDFAVETVTESAETGERMIRKLRAGMMPPPGMPRPGPDTLLALVETLENQIDAEYDLAPNPGIRTFPRLNRPEYESMIYDLLALEVDAGDWLPLDTKSENFDNIADAQALSPTLLEAYLNAAREISRLATGDANAPAVNRTYTVPEYISQHPWDRVEGAPFGTRGGTVIDHIFPADGEYFLEMTFRAGGNSRLHDLDVSIDGENVVTLPYESFERGVALRTDPIVLRAGQHRVSVAFIRHSEGPYEDLIRPHDWSLAGGGSGGAGITTLPHLEDLVIGGPFNATGVSETPSRQKIFVCRPTAASEEERCAREIISDLVTTAYRRPATSEDVDGLMMFYESGANDGTFEDGVRTALEAILASPHFVFRIEREQDVTPGENYRLSDVDLANRLSFFLWGSPPDAELLSLASRGELRDGGELERQASRMLADSRSEALGSRFLAQWLRLQDLYKNHPNPNFFPNFDENLADAMATETQMFFNQLVREDRSFFELYSADYSFVNERLARHYGYQDVAGDQFRRVQSDPNRKGILGHGSILVLTALADRTSPVLRGKWVMEVLLGTPPPPPPDGVPALEETEGSVAGQFITTRQRMEMHRANPVCESCHKFMDPMGLALDNFDVAGQWRVKENGQPLDTRGELYDGTPISNPAELVNALLNRPIPLVRTFTLNLMAYAMGRRVEYTDQPALRAIVKEAEEDGYKMSSFIMAVINSPPFQMKRAVAVAEDTEVNGNDEQ